MNGNDKTEAKFDLAESGSENWVKPEITSFEPVKAAEGISYTTSDGLTNMTP